MKYFFIFFCHLNFNFSIPIPRANVWYPTYTSLNQSDFTILENSYSTLRSDPLDNPSKNRKDILLLALSYLHQKDMNRFKELLKFFLQHIEQRDGDELISYIPAFTELLKYHNNEHDLSAEISEVLRVFEDKVSFKELSKHVLYRFYFSKLIALSLPQSSVDSNQKKERDIQLLQKGLPYYSSYCLYKQSILFMDKLHLVKKATTKQVIENKFVLASWIQSTKFAHKEATLLMEEYQSIRKPSLYQHKEYKKAVLLCISIYQHFRSKVLFFLRKKSFHEKHLPGVYKNRAFSLHRFYTSSNSTLQQIKIELQNPVSKSACIDFNRGFGRHIKKYNLLSQDSIQAFDSSIDLDESLKNYRKVFIKSKSPFYSENVIQTCLKLYPIRFE
ncbi:MAG: hypothetical protein KC646_07560 [Candidatus Cloacimonetes bacterium]|nr:hypothetical protein [Candidatus Cloacimonadota bacterium]